jgi:hypothetical protein
MTGRLGLGGEKRRKKGMHGRGEAGSNGNHPAGSRRISMAPAGVLNCSAVTSWLRRAE